ncbi:MAG: alginate lyase family protein, partial [Myxococcota bacterium]
AKVALFNAFPGKRLFLPSLLALFSVACGDAVSVDENANVELDETEPQITQARSTPVVFIDEDQIETIRDRIRRGEAPWTAAYRRVVDEGNPALDAGPWSVTANGGPAGGHDFFTEPPYCGWTRVDGNPPDCRDSQFNPEANRVDYTAALRVAEAARDLGLAYTFSRDPRYSRRLASVIRTWALDSATKLNPRFTNGQSRIELSITMPALFYGASLIESSGALTSEERGQFRDWVSDFADSALNWTGHNNFENWRHTFIAAAGAYLAGDRGHELRRYAFQRFRDVIPQYISSAGHMMKETGRARAFMYSMYALTSMVATAEIARNYDVDLYGYQTSTGKGLKLALDRHVRFALDVNSWPYSESGTMERKDFALYEVAHSHYGDPDYLRVIDRWGRPMEEKRVMGFVTLTHGDQFESDPNSPPPPSDSDKEMFPCQEAGCVVANRYESGQWPQNMVDGSLATRWSAEGDGAAATFRFDDIFEFDRLELAFQHGDRRVQEFEVQGSEGCENFWTIRGGLTSSGETLELQNFDLPNKRVGCLRLVGFGNTENDWTSITEARFFRR